MGDLETQHRSDFTWFNPVELRFTWGGLARLPQLVGGRKTALVLFPEAATLGLRGRIERLLPGLVTVIDDVPPNPAFDHVDRLHRDFWRGHPGTELIVAVGGGSVIDTAKCLSVDSAAGLRGVLDPSQPCRAHVPLIAVPTTAGTGSEVTPWATLWEPKASPPRKLSLHRAETWPHAALVDPQLTSTLPRAATIAGALDALSHALEAIWNNNANAISDRLAVTAARSVLAALPAVLAAPAEPAGRIALSRAAMLAGLAFSNTRTALAHEISYALTLRRGITHGIACSAPLPLVWRLAQGRSADRDRLLEEIIGCPVGDGAARLEEFLQAMGVATDLRRYDFSAAEIDAIVDQAQSGARGRNFIAH